MIIRKYTPKGLLLWEKIEQQRGYSYKPRQMRIDGYGNLMIAGEYNLPSDNPNYSNQKVFLAKHFGSNGNNAWMKVEYPPATASALSFRGLALDPSGNMIVTLGDAANYASAAGLVKYSKLGVFQWRKVIQPYEGDPTGAKKVATDNLGNVYVLIDGNSTGAGGGQHLMLAKYTPTGNLDWLRVFLNGMAARFDAAMTVGGDGSAYVSMTDGTSSATMAKKDLIVKKISSANILVWTKTYSSGDSTIQTPRDMEIDPAGSIYVVGSTKRRVYVDADPYFELTSKMLVLKYSTTGNLVWSVNTASPFVAVSNEGRRLRFQYATGKNPAFYVLGQTEYDAGPSYLADDIITLRYSASAIVNTLGSVGPEVSPDPKIGSSLSAYPNPFRGTTTISFELPGTSMIKLTVYDVNGRLIQTMLHKQLLAGKHDVVFDGSTYAGQQLFYALDGQGESGTFYKTGSLSVMR